MSKSSPLHRFDAAVQAYISSRRALGRAIRLDEYVLHRLRAYLAGAGYSDLDAESFEGWRRQLHHCAHNTQVDWAMMIYRFCRYRRRRESQCFLPQRETLGRHRPYPLPTPIEADQVRRLLDFISRRPASAGRDLPYAVHRIAIVLMYTAGLRRGELARLRLEDADAETGVLRIQGSKFHKSRWVPLSPSATQELQRYLRVRAAFVPRTASNAMLLCRSAERGYTAEGMSQAIRGVMCRSGIWANAPTNATCTRFSPRFCGGGASPLVRGGSRRTVRAAQALDVHGARFDRFDDLLPALHAGGSRPCEPAFRRLVRRSD